MDVRGPLAGMPVRTLGSRPKTPTLSAIIHYHGTQSPAGIQSVGALRIHDAGLANLFTCEIVTGSSFRRQVFYWRAQHENLLPPDLSGAYGPGKKCPVFSQRRRRGRSRL